jgi:dolichol-phosphate mannosyltransferase
MEPGFPENSFSLVIPTLNEAGNIDRVLRELTDSLRNTQHEYEVIVVDDGSTDGTVEQVRSWAARDPRIRLLSRAGEKGLAGAVLYGWGHSRANFLGVMDADLQHPPQLLPRLLEEAGRADIAIASRYAQEHGTKGWNPLRAVVSRLSTLAAAPLISRKKLRVTDPMSGFFVIRRRCIKGLVFQTTGFKLLLEILVRGRIQNVREVPYQFGLRQVGQSKANATVALHYLHLLGRLSRDLVLHPSGQ